MIDGTTATPAQIGLRLEGPRRQSRLGVAFRFVLAIPHLVWLELVLAVAALAVVAGWMAAVVIGRVPRGIAAFVTGALQYTARVYGYALYLLTDGYPPFSLQDPHPIELVDVPEPPRLNRLAVLFRLILVLPALLVLEIVGSGLGIALVVIWIVVLVSGRLPAPLFEAEAAILRYGVRVFAYGAMLTTEYPRGLFGDAVPGPPPDGANETAPDAATDASGPPGVCCLVLSKAARRLVLGFAVLGLVGIGGSAGVAALDSNDANETLGRQAAEHDRLGAAFQTFRTETQACAMSSGFECTHGAIERLAGELDAFRRDLADVDLPASADGRAAAIDRDVEQLTQLLRRLNDAPDPSEYRRVAGRFQTVADQFDRDYAALVQALLASPAP